MGTTRLPEEQDRLPLRECPSRFFRQLHIPVIFQVASLLAALTHPGHIVTYAPGDSLPCRRDPS
ncbi:hypothetical protein C6H68_01600 [Photorhabdus luminescens]|uniref:Uncharacterized protein n=1 Tax=Photorhabdus laumondii subsp. clarkei TaxID=2029685 RepID=A0A329VPH1_9GAMM|nr:hypothetical protein C6H68_01600 [Photorhabdus luminescens]RAW93612.1 hypothetical protein CKY01_01445 [Photorhabdus laumondii subsp. clarkei]